jgi:O-antigen/teichoic acid export membrane protein
MQSVDLPLIPEQLKLFWKTPLYRNAVYLIIGNGMGALLGFVYWAVAARLYSAADVGTASAIISAIGMLAAFSSLGLGLGLVRFLPEAREKGNDLINSSLTLILAASIVTGILFILGTSIWSEELSFLRNNPFYFILFLVFTAVTAWGNLIDNISVSERRSVFVTLRSLIYSLGKLGLVILLAGTLNSTGIVNSWGIATIISILVIGFFCLPAIRRGYFPRPQWHWQQTRAILPYSISNNLSVILWSLPTWILPLMVLNELGAESNANFYIAWTIGLALAMVPTSVATSVFAEGSFNEKGLESKALRSISLGIFITLPIVILLLLFGGKLLLLFGSDYMAYSFRLVQIVTLTLFPLTINQVFFSVLRVHKRMKMLLAAAAFITFVTLSLSLILLSDIGILGGGIAWLVGQTLVAVWAMCEQHWWKKLVHQMGTMISKAVSIKLKTVSNDN